MSDAAETPPAVELVRATEHDDTYFNYLGGVEQLDESPYAGAVHLNAWIGSDHVGSVVYGVSSGAMFHAAGGQSIWVFHLYVRPEHRGRGVGQALMQHVAGAARRRRCGIDGDFTDAAGTLRAHMNALIAEDAADDQ